MFRRHNKQKRQTVFFGNKQDDSQDEDESQNILYYIPNKNNDLEYCDMYEKQETMYSLNRAKNRALESTGML